MIENFQFLRPEWFYGLVPSALLFAILIYRQGRGSNWEQAIAPELLSHLIDQHQQTSQKPVIYSLLLVWLLAITAMAGPVWQKTPQPVHERQNALVIIFDLTRSMYATDVKPNRLVRARRKLADLLDMRDEGVTGLIVYAGDAHVVSPLTDDAKTIKELVPAISPEIMPAPGSLLTPALKAAQSLFKDAGLSSGRILIVTDEIRDLANAQALAREFHNAYPVSVLAVGTAEGAPIKVPVPQRNQNQRGRNSSNQSTEQSKFLRDNSGNLIVPKVNLSALQDFAQNAGGRFSQISLEDSDLDYLLADSPLEDQEQFREVDRDFDIWFEEGPWLLLLLLPLAAGAFRRGYLWGFAVILILPVEDSYAFTWDDLWYSKDQQASQALTSGDTNKAAELFENPQWKASAQYKTEDFASAATNFSQAKDHAAWYNLGNSLAKQQQYENAIKAYQKSLALNPDNEDATFNQQLVEKLLESQQQQDQENKEQQENDQDKEENKEQQDQGGESDQQQDQDTDGEQSDKSSEEKEAEEKESEAQDEAKKDDDESEEPATDQQMADTEMPEPLDEEQKQALQQWLRRVPDDPGGLLRRKFEMQYNERMKNRRRGQNDSSNW